MRTFIAVEIHNEEVLNAIIKIQSNFMIKATPVNKQNLHFTLLFLGEIDEKNAENVKKELASISFRPIEVKFSHIGAFPNPRFPRVIWIGVDKVASQQLIDLASHVEKKLEPFGFKSNKPFKPHLAIFRIKNKVCDISQTLEKFKVIEISKEVITELKLKQSILTPNGPIYSDLQVVLAK